MFWFFHSRPLRQVLDLDDNSIEKKHRNNRFKQIRFKSLKLMEGQFKNEEDTKRLTTEEVIKAFIVRCSGRTTLALDANQIYKSFVKENPLLNHKTIIDKDNLRTDDKKVQV